VRRSIITLDLSRKELVEALDLSEFINLENLDVSFNKISLLILPNSNKLEKLITKRNPKLKFFYLLNLNPNNLVEFSPNDSVHYLLSAFFKNFSRQNNYPPT
jgi:hypothetical protein